MKKNIVVVFLMCWLAGCGGSNNDTSQSPSLSENSSQPPPVNTLPSNPIEKPTIDYDDQLLTDIEEFVKLAHAVQYFYPSEESKNSDWPLFIAESIIELSQTPVNERASKGIELVRQIAPYLTSVQNQLPNIDEQNQASTWRQNSPIDEDVYSRALITSSYRALQTESYVSNHLFTELDYHQTSVYLPLYLPSNNELTGQTYRTLGRWQLTQNFMENEVCMASVSSMWASIQHFWPYFSQVSVDWQSSLPNLLSACTEDDFLKRRARIYSEFTKLKDNHINIALPLPEQYVRNRYIPFLYELVEDQAIVVRVEENQQTGVEIGDEILAINGQKIQTYLESKSDTSLKNDLHRKTVPALSDVFKSSADPISYQVKKPDNQIINIQVTPKLLSELTNFYGLRYVPRRDEALEALSDGLYRVNVYKVKSAETRVIKEQLKNAKGVILDLRRYPEDWQGWQTVLSWFIKRPAINDTLAYYWQGAPNQTDIQIQQVSQTINPASGPLNMPVIVLSSRDSQSQNEHSLIFARSGGLTIMGEPTSGINGNIVQLDLFGGLNNTSSQGVTFIYTNMRANRWNGDPLINAGIEPDILLPRTVESLQKQIDNQLAAAIDYLKQRIE